MYQQNESECFKQTHNADTDGPSAALVNVEPNYTSIGLTS